LAYKDKKNVDAYKANLKFAIKNSPDDFSKQSVILKILLEADK